MNTQCGRGESVVSETMINESQVRGTEAKCHAPKEGEDDDEFAGGEL